MTHSKVLGMEFERYIEKCIKGKYIGEIYDEADYETVKNIYEIKGCKIVTSSKVNGSKQDSKDTSRFGRYNIKTKNHEKLYDLAKDKNKEPKYFFVLKLQKRLIFKSKPWSFVDELIDDSKKVNLISVNVIWS